VVGEVLFFNLGAVLDVHVIAPEAKADRSAGLDFSAPALAMGSRSLTLSGQDAEVDLY
jgi:hypothetical protein